MLKLSVFFIFIAILIVSTSMIEPFVARIEGSTEVLKSINTVAMVCAKKNGFVVQLYSYTVIHVTASIPRLSIF